MLKLKRLIEKNVEEILKLSFDNQRKKGLATNNISIIEAYIAVLRIMMYSWYL